MHLYKYNTDIPEECWAVRIGDRTLYVYANRGDDGEVMVELNNGFEEGSKPYRLENAIFKGNHAAIQAAAEEAIARLEASRSPAPTV